MPYKLRKAPKRDLFWVVGMDGKKHSKDPLPKDQATAQMRALYASMTREKSGGMTGGNKKEYEHWRSHLGRLYDLMNRTRPVPASGRNMAGVEPLPPAEGYDFNDDAYDLKGYIQKLRRALTEDKYIPWARDAYRILTRKVASYVGDASLERGNEDSDSDDEITGRFHTSRQKRPVGLGRGMCGGAKLTIFDAYKEPLKSKLMKQWEVISAGPFHPGTVPLLEGLPRKGALPPFKDFLEFAEYYVRVKNEEEDASAELAEKKKEERFQEVVRLITLNNPHLTKKEVNTVAQAIIVGHPKPFSLVGRGSMRGSGFMDFFGSNDPSTRAIMISDPAEQRANTARAYDALQRTQDPNTNIAYQRDVQQRKDEEAQGWKDTFKTIGDTFGGLGQVAKLIPGAGNVLGNISSGIGSAIGSLGGGGGSSCGCGALCGAGGKKKLFAQLRKYGIEPSVYLKEAKGRAKKHKYDPSTL